MPNEVTKEQDDFNSVFDEIVTKTDEEIAEDAEKEAEAKPAEESGDSTKEQEEADAKKKADEADLIKSITGEDKVGDDPAPNPGEKTDTALESRVAELEAELKKEHQRTSSWDGRIKAANSRVKELEAENQSLKDQLVLKKDDAEPAEEEKSEEEIMAVFKKTFPEFVEVLDLYNKKIEAVSTPITPAKVTEPDPVVEPEAKPDVPVQSDHLKTIHKVHGDLDEMVGTGVLATWINKQPDYVRDHLQSVYDKGTAQQVINLCNAFKEKTGWKSQLDTGDTSKEDKLNSMKEAEGESAGPKNTEGPDKNDFEGAAKEIGL